MNTFPDDPPPDETDALLLQAAARFDLVLVPGRFDSGPQHWQSVWERQQPAAWQRLTQQQWTDGDIHRWNGSLRRLLARSRKPSLLVGHSLGALAACCSARALPSGVVAGVMLVAPAEPAKFHAEGEVPECALGVPSVLVASQNDPFMSHARAEHWAGVWGSELVDLGEAGHVNVESGFGPWAWGKRLVLRLAALADAAALRGAAGSAFGDVGQ